MEEDTTWTADASGDLSRSASRRSSVAIEGHVASNDLLNPSDALDLLAHVADLDPSRQSKNAGQSGRGGGTANQESSKQAVTYPPIANGALGFADATALVQ